MHLGVHREASVVEALDQVGLPQRTVPVEQGAVQPGGQLEQFADPARGRQRRAAQVVLQVDVGAGLATR